MVFSPILKSCKSSSSRSCKADNDSSKKLDFKDIKFPAKLEIYAKLKKQILSALVILFMKSSSINALLFILQAFSTKEILKCLIKD